MQYISTHGELVNGLHTPKLWCSRSLNEKPHVLDLKLIDVINVSYMFCRSYFLQILHAFSI